MTPAWAVYLDAGWGDFLTSGGNTTVSGSVDLGARYHFRPRAGVLVPFLQGALSNRAFSQDVPSSISPPAVNLMSSRVRGSISG